jgi:anti-sigma-K factor RskA
MSDLPLSPAEMDDALAAEYVLGTLDLSERLAAQSRIASDPAFAAAVQAWENRLSGLNDGYDPVPVRDLMPAIEARLFPKAAQARSRGFRWLSGWLAGAVAAGAVALAALVWLPILPPAAGPVVAVLGKGEPLSFEARFKDGQLDVIRVAGEAAPAGQVQEVWLIAPGAAPVSLGLMPERALSVPYPDLPEGWTLAVSLEPAGGSPTGAPTGPVLAAGVVGDL